MLLGVLVSALLQQFVSEQRIRRMIPKNPVLGILFACVMGLLFPLCECGMIPVIRRLMRKGMPAYVATVFILVGPIINPVVFASTYIAFRDRPEMAYSRMALAFIAALAIGLIVHRFVKRNPVRGTLEDGAYGEAAALGLLKVTPILRLSKGMSVGKISMRTAITITMAESVITPPLMCTVILTPIIIMTTIMNTARAAGLRQAGNSCPFSAMLRTNFSIWANI
ncbi:permease [Paenibacillus sp. P26]|nr:permease [Paenibacillus sp. P26]